MPFRKNQTGNPAHEEIGRFYSGVKKDANTRAANQRQRRIKEQQQQKSHQKDRRKK